MMETEGERRWRVFLLEGRPVLVETPGGEVVPFVGLIREVPDLLPRVVVDLGAVRYIANGADVMGPGVVSVEEGVEEGSL
ncbi:MAG: RNA-binding protein, partial [Thermoproteota archaeon]